MTTPFLYSHQTSPNEIKKGLEKIKLAQMEVLKQLRKEETHEALTSPTDSQDARYNRKNQQAENKIQSQRIEQLEQSLSACLERQKTLRQAHLRMSAQIRDKRQQVDRLSVQIKRLQKSESEALEKAESALRSAIESEKKFIQAKSGRDQLSKYNQTLRSELNKLQQKNLTTLIENQTGIYSRVSKDLRSLNEIHLKMNQQTSKSTKRAEEKTRLQDQYNGLLNDIIITLNYAQETFPQVRMASSQNNYISKSFRDDIKQIEQEIDRGVKSQQEKQNQLKKENQYLSKINKQLKADIQEYEQEITILKNYLKTEKQSAVQLKIAKQIMEDENALIKKIGAEKVAALEKEKQEYRKQLQATNDLKRMQRSSKRKRQYIVEAKVEKDTKGNQQLNQKQKQIQRLENSNSALQEVIKNLKTELESIEQMRRHEAERSEYELNKIRAQIAEISAVNMREKTEWREMLDAIRRLQEERSLAIAKQEELNRKLNESQRIREHESAQLNAKIMEVITEVGSLRKENSAINYERSQLIRLQKKQDRGREALIYDRVVDELWRLKESEYGSVNTILSQMGGNRRRKRPIFPQ